MSEQNAIANWASKELRCDSADISAVWIASIDGDLWVLAETPTNDMERVKYLGDTVNLSDIAVWLVS